MVKGVKVCSLIVILAIFVSVFGSAVLGDDLSGGGLIQSVDDVGIQTAVENPSSEELTKNFGAETDDAVNIEFVDRSARVGSVKAAININDIVEVYNTLDSGLKMHKDSPTGETLKVIPDGLSLKVIGGPQYNINGYDWWEVKEEEYETSPVIGWVAEHYITKVATPENLVPSSPPNYFVSNHLNFRLYILHLQHIHNLPLFS